MSNEQQQNNAMSDDKKQAIQTLQKYGGKFATLILVILGGYFGWTYYQQHTAGDANTEVSDAYMDILNLEQQIAMSQNNPKPSEKDKQALAKQEKQLQSQVDSLVSKYGDNIYAWQSLISKASVAMNENDTKSAVKALQSAMNMKIDDKGLHAITQLRYAQALLANNQIKEAKDIANKVTVASFEPSKQELLGDIFVAEKDEKSAQSAYQKAWDVLAKRKENRDLLRLKMESIGMQVTDIETKALFAETPVDITDEVLSKDELVTEKQLEAEQDAPDSSINKQKTTDE